MFFVNSQKRERKKERKLRLVRYFNLDFFKVTTQGVNAVCEPAAYSFAKKIFTVHIFLGFFRHLLTASKRLHGYGFSKE